MDNKAYHEADGFSSTQIKDFLTGPPRMFQAKHITKEVERQDKPAFSLGTAVHTMVLEPHLAEKELVVEPTDINKRTKAGKALYAEWLESNKDKTILSQAMYDQAKLMAESLLANKETQMMLKDSEVEQSIFVEDEETGLLLKIRADILNMGFLADVKTAQSASMASFESSVKKFKYHVSAAMYLDVARQAGYDMETFFFAVVEKEVPYLSATYVLSEDLLAEGHALYREGVLGIKNCIATKNWCGYNNDELAVIGANLNG